MMEKYTVEYQLHVKEQNTRTVEVEMDRVPDLNNQEELHGLTRLYLTRFVNRSQVLRLYLLREPEAIASGFLHNIGGVSK